MKSYKLAKREIYALSVIFIVHIIASVFYTKMSALHNLIYMTLLGLLTAYFLQFVGRALFYIYSLIAIPLVAVEFHVAPSDAASKMIAMIFFEAIAFVSLCFVLYLHVKYKRNDKYLIKKKQRRKTQ